MEPNTAIDSDDYEIEADPAINDLIFSNNKKIEHLPVEVAITFPVLNFYSARNCSIKTIAKIHFKGLTFLKTLNLGENQIETIRSNTFEDLVSLTNLVLGEKKVLWVSMSFDFLKPIYKQILTKSSRWMDNSSTILNSW